MTEPVEEERTLVHSDGYETSVLVSRISPGRYRLEDAFAVMDFEEVSEEAGHGEQPAVGWIIDVEELDDYPPVR